MKKILNTWKIFLKENLGFEFDQGKLLDKVRDIFFGAYDSWTEEFKKLHDEEFMTMYSDLEKNVNSSANLTDNDRSLIIGNANIGLTLYWSGETKRGYGSSEIVKKVIDKKLQILEEAITDEELEFLKSGGMSQILTMISSERGTMMFPSELAVGVGVINGQKVLDAFMSAPTTIVRHINPVLRSKGYSVKDVSTKEKSRKRRAPKMSPEEMLAQMKKFGNR